MAIAFTEVSCCDPARLKTFLGFDGLISLSLLSPSRFEFHSIMYESLFVWFCISGTIRLCKAPVSPYGAPFPL